ncbi:MAG: peptidoglycan recognition protein family protein [Clostridia bacterium]|nr:peptidoglycan recognition protein family protein [Clostridia bacterium]
MNVIQTNFRYRSTLTPLNLNNIQYIIIHHSASETSAPEQIHQWHLANGWSGFGYNEYIRKDGTVYIGRGDHIGAHCSGLNSVGYGICCEGNYSAEKSMPQAQLDALLERIRFNKSRFPAVKSIMGHRDLNSTDCPGKYFPFASARAAFDHPISKSHWAKQEQDELLAAGILKEDHSGSLDKPATEAFVICLINRLRKDGR